MSLSYILKKVKSEIGWADDTLTDEIEQKLIDKVNEACREIYKKQDLPVALKEIFVNVNANDTICLPAFVGEIRAIRNRVFNGKMKLLDIRPRYASSDWPQKWNAGRMIGESALAIDIVNAVPLQIVYPDDDADLSFTLIGETDNSNRAVDTITMSTAIKVGTKNFTDVRSIKKNKLTEFDALVQGRDEDGNLIDLAVIYADQLDARYLIMDISQYPQLQDCADGTYVMETLYKPRLGLLVNPEDEFPLIGYDDIIALKVEQLLTEKEEGKEKRAILMHERGKELLTEMIGDKSNHMAKKITSPRNPLLGMFKTRIWRKSFDPK